MCIRDSISPALAAGQSYSLSFWYLQSTNGGPLTVRLTGSGITSGSIIPAPGTPATINPAATPGSSNFVSVALPAFPTLWINEVHPENLTGITNSAGQRTPWLELFN